MGDITVLGAIQVLRNADGDGGSVNFSGEKRYEGAIHRVNPSRILCLDVDTKTGKNSQNVRYALGGKKLKFDDPFCEKC